VNSRPRRCRDERGVAVVVGIGLVGMLVLVTALSVGTVAIVLAHRRAQVAADLASLAGAAALQRGADPCTAAGTIAGRQQAELTRCVVDGSTVAVATAVSLPLALGGGDLPARARAGPVLTPGVGLTPAARP
jgi:secretion/DNA translocation related TadE-like protein